MADYPQGVSPNFGNYTRVKRMLNECVEPPRAAIACLQDAWQRIKANGGDWDQVKALIESAERALHGRRT